MCSCCRSDEEVADSVVGGAVETDIVGVEFGTKLCAAVGVEGKEGQLAQPFGQGFQVTGSIENGRI